ncbi:unnamed protein product [Discula destructiva]
MPSFFVPARDSRHRAACFALYRALLRQVPHISLPNELTSRPDWINPIRYLIRSGFRRNKTDTSPRLVTSALTSGYRFLALLTRASDTSSASHAEILTFLDTRQRAFPPPRIPQPPPAPAAVATPPLLTKVSGPGQKPLYASTARPLPLAQLSGGKRKIPQLEDASGVPFLRIGKPQSPTHANFIGRKVARRQARLTAFLEMGEVARQEAAAEDAWEKELGRLALREGVDIEDDDEGGAVVSYERVVVEFGLEHFGRLLRDEVVDMQARATAMLDIIDEEEKLAVREKKERDEKRKRAWEERGRHEKTTEASDKMIPGAQHSERRHEARDTFGGESRDDWADDVVHPPQQRMRNAVRQRQPSQSHKTT